MQTLHATVASGCHKFDPQESPFLGAAVYQILISWSSLPLPTNPVWWTSMCAISSYCGNRQTDPETQRHIRLITVNCTAPLRSCVQC